jgi:3-oxoacyl-(acyl-carrier-protein) synthase
MVSPLGCGTEVSWARLLAGDNAARKVTEFEVEDLPAKIACRIPFGDGSDGTFNADDWMEPKEQRKVDPFIVYAMAAADMALADAGWKPESDEDQISTGVLIGSGIGGLEGIVDAGYTLRDKGPRRISPFFIPGRLINLAAGQVSIRHKLRGPNHSVVTACSTGAHAIGDASRLIALGDADVMVAGGTESPICRISLAGFAACKALSTQHNDNPEKASRPYDADRDGFVMGEGAGIVVLEELEHARARGAKIYAEVIGYGLSGDAFHITAPSEDGEGAYPLHADGAEARGRHGCGHRLYQRSRNIDDGRHDRARRGRTAGRRQRVEDLHVLDEVGHRAFARRSRRGRSHLFGARNSRQYSPADAQPGQPFRRDEDRSRAACRAQARDQRGPVELVRFRRHQRVVDSAPLHRPLIPRAGVLRNGLPR